MTDIFIDTDNRWHTIVKLLHMQGTTIITVIFKRLQREQSGGSGKNSGGPRGRAKAEGGGQKASNRVLSGESGQSTTPPPSSSQLVLLLHVCIFSCTDSSRGSATKRKEIGMFGIGWWQSTVTHKHSMQHTCTQSQTPHTVTPLVIYQKDQKPQHGRSLL